MNDFELPKDREQWVKNPIQYRDLDSMLRDVELGFPYRHKGRWMRLEVKAEQNTWGWAMVRRDGVGIAYWRDPDWKPNRERQM